MEILIIFDLFINLIGLEEYRRIDTVYVVWWVTVGWGFKPAVNGRSFRGIPSFGLRLWFDKFPLETKNVEGNGTFTLHSTRSSSLPPIIIILTSTGNVALGSKTLVWDLPQLLRIAQTSCSDSYF